MYLGRYPSNTFLSYGGDTTIVIKALTYLLLHRMEQFLKILDYEQPSLLLHRMEPFKIIIKL